MKQPTLHLTEILKTHHHPISAIMDRVEKAKKEAAIKQKESTKPAS